MRRFSLFLIVAIYSIQVLYAQSPPAWIEDSYRAMVYPANEYYLGFSQERVSRPNMLASEIERLKQDARNKLSESIIVRHAGQTNVYNRSYMYASGEKASEKTSTHYSQNIQSITETVLANVETRTYYDATESIIYAFACVSKKDLESYYQRSIRLLMDRASSIAETAFSYCSIGEIKQAKEKLIEARSLVESMEPYFRMLASVNPSCPELEYYSDTNLLYSRICSSLTEVDKGPSIFVEVTYSQKDSPDEPFSSDPNLFGPIIRQALGEAGSIICNDSEKADYLLSIETSSSVRSLPKEGDFGIISYYANVAGKIVNQHTGKEISSFILFKEADCYASGSTKEKAATKAFLLPALKNKVIFNILNSISL